MSQSRSLRQQTLQLLCQFDAGNCDVASITEETFDEDISETLPPNQKVSSLAKKVWDTKDKADETIAPLTPDWPTHRQPLVDRNILRLAYFEITSGMTPPIVAIDEAIDLAKEFGTQESPAFINGVLNQIKEQCDANGKNSETAAP